MGMPIRGRPRTALDEVEMDTGRSECRRLGDVISAMIASGSYLIGALDERGRSGLLPGRTALPHRERQRAGPYVDTRTRRLRTGVRLVDARGEAVTEIPAACFQTPDQVRTSTSGRGRPSTSTVGQAGSMVRISMPAEVVTTVSSILAPGRL